MKVVFICGSLEPARDGVGDYTRRLAAELIRRGDSPAIISINDKYTLNKTAEIQQCEETGVPVLRLPSNLTWKTRAEYANSYIEKFDPDWLSLQLVIYSFHPRGWMGNFNKFFSPVLAKYKTHIMWHELWIGQLTNSSIAEKLEGRFQKMQLDNLLRIVKPKLQHTSILFYQMLLKKRGINAGWLPLMSNFPAEKDEGFDLKSKLNLTSEEGNALIAVCFGTVHAKFPFRQWLTEAATWNQKTGRPIVLCLLGRANESMRIWKEWHAILNENRINKVRLVAIGALTAMEIRAAFATAELGVFFTALEGWGKSGSVLAMLESGLPAMGYNQNISRFEFENKLPCGIIELNINKLNNWPVLFKRHKAFTNLAKVYDQFINDIKYITQKND